jgi:hypothetical protein
MIAWRKTRAGRADQKGIHDHTTAAAHSAGGRRYLVPAESERISHVVERVGESYHEQSKKFVGE